MTNRIAAAGSDRHAPDLQKFNLTERARDTQLRGSEFSVTDMTLIGAGGSATVYSGFDAELGPVAIKVIRTAGSTSDKKFRREMDALASLSQIDGVVKVLRTGATVRGEPYLVMPLLDRSLQQLVRHGGALDIWEAAHVMQTVAQTLHASHDAGVIHGDIKPGNILLDHDGNPLIADFGIARVIDASLSVSSQLLMTPHYAAPELFDGKSPSPLSDVYAVAATLYALVCGKPPFAVGEDDTPVALMRRITALEDNLDLSALQAPDDYKQIIRKGMAKEPTDRYPTAADFASDLGAHLLEQTVDVGILRRRSENETSDISISLANDNTTVTHGYVRSPVDDPGDLVVRPSSAEANLDASQAASQAANLDVPYGNIDELVVENGATTGRFAVAAVPGIRLSDQPDLTHSSLLRETTDTIEPDFAERVPLGHEERRPLLWSRHSSLRDLGRWPKSKAAYGVVAVALTVFASWAISSDSGTVSAGVSSEAAAPSEGEGVRTGVGADASGAAGLSGQDESDLALSPELDQPESGQVELEPPEQATDQSQPGAGANGSSIVTEAESGRVPTTGAETADTRADQDRATTTPTTNPSTAPTTTATTTRQESAGQETTTADTKPGNGRGRPDGVVKPHPKKTTTTAAPTTATTRQTTTEAQGVAVRIVSGPSVDIVNSTSFHFGYSTNDVCATGNFSIYNVDGGYSVGTWTGENVCWGPYHDAYPGRAGDTSFGWFDLEPNTTYRVNVWVNGTASDGSKPTGTGSASASFTVKTTG